MNSNEWIPEKQPESFKISDNSIKIYKRMYNNYAITGEQMKAIKAVEKAMKLAEKAGVGFWDNYGTITAFNAKEIHCPVPDKSVGPELNLHHIYGLRVNNFTAGNADDQLYVSFR